MSSTRTKRFLLIIPDGVGIRNFFCTDFIDRLLEHGEVCVWHGLNAAGIDPFREHWGSRVRWEPLPSVRDGVMERLLRQAKQYSQLYWQLEKGGAIQLKRRQRILRFKARAMDIAARILGRSCATPGRIVFLDRAHQAVAARYRHMREFRSFLAELQPDFAFCSHQRSLHAVPALLAAREMGIGTATFIYSWDNLPKGRMPVVVDQYFVWSDFMRDELMGLYPDVPASRIQVVGTPQFESYEDASLIIPREKFLRDLGLEPKRPVVCFSGDDVLTSPYDPDYLADLARAFRRLPDAERPQILFRRSPVDLSGRYAAVLAEFPEIAISDPLWASCGNDEWWSNVVPTREDIGLLVNVVYHSDLVVNLGSTMAMDFAIYDKPGIFLAYNPAAANGRWNVADLYKMPHFRAVHEIQPVYWARSAADLANITTHALRFPKEKSDSRRAWLGRTVKLPLKDASKRCASAVVRLASQRPD